MSLEYPRVLYKANGETKYVRSDNERDAALDEGWKLSEAVANGAPEPEPEKPAKPGRKKSAE